jgi:hypothetical protein
MSNSAGVASAAYLVPQQKHHFCHQLDACCAACCLCHLPLLLLQQQQGLRRWQRKLGQELQQMHQWFGELMLLMLNQQLMMPSQRLSRWVLLLLLQQMHHSLAGLRDDGAAHAPAGIALTYTRYTYVAEVFYHERWLASYSAVC